MESTPPSSAPPPLTDVEPGGAPTLGGSPGPVAPPTARRRWDAKPFLIRLACWLTLLAAWTTLGLMAVETVRSRSPLSATVVSGAALAAVLGAIGARSSRLPLVALQALTIVYFEVFLATIVEGPRFPPVVFLGRPASYWASALTLVGLGGLWIGASPSMAFRSFRWMFRLFLGLAAIPFTLALVEAGDFCAGLTRPLWSTHGASPWTWPGYIAINVLFPVGWIALGARWLHARAAGRSDLALGCLALSVMLAFPEAAGLAQLNRWDVPNLSSWITRARPTGSLRVEIQGEFGAIDIEAPGGPPRRRSPAWTLWAQPAHLRRGPGGSVTLHVAIEPTGTGRPLTHLGASPLRARWAGQVGASSPGPWQSLTLQPAVVPPAAVAIVWTGRPPVSSPADPGGHWVTTLLGPPARPSPLIESVRRMAARLGPTSPLALFGPGDTGAPSDSLLRLLDRLATAPVTSPTVDRASLDRAIEWLAARPETSRHLVILGAHGAEMSPEIPRSRLDRAHAAAVIIHGVLPASSKISGSPATPSLQSASDLTGGMMVTVADGDALVNAMEAVSVRIHPDHTASISLPDGGPPRLQVTSVPISDGLHGQVSVHSSGGTWPTTVVLRAGTGRVLLGGLESVQTVVDAFDLAGGQRLQGQATDASGRTTTFDAPLMELAQGGRILEPEPACRVVGTIALVGRLARPAIGRFQIDGIDVEQLGPAADDSVPSRPLPVARRPRPGRPVKAVPPRVVARVAPLRRSTVLGLPVGARAATGTLRPGAPTLTEAESTTTIGFPGGASISPYAALLAPPDSPVPGLAPRTNTVAPAPHESPAAKQASLKAAAPAAAGVTGMTTAAAPVAAVATASLSVTEVTTTLVSTVLDTRRLTPGAHRIQLVVGGESTGLTTATSPAMLSPLTVLDHSWIEVDRPAVRVLVPDLEDGQRVSGSRDVRLVLESTPLGFVTKGINATVDGKAVELAGTPPSLLCLDASLLGPGSHELILTAVAPGARTPPTRLRFVTDQSRSWIDFPGITQGYPLWRTTRLVPRLGPPGAAKVERVEYTWEGRTIEGSGPDHSLLIDPSAASAPGNPPETSRTHGWTRIRSRAVRADGSAASALLRVDMGGRPVVRFPLPDAAGTAGWSVDGVAIPPEHVVQSPSRLPLHVALGLEWEPGGRVPMEYPMLTDGATELALRREGHHSMALVGFGDGATTVVTEPGFDVGPMVRALGVRPPASAPWLPSRGPRPLVEAADTLVGLLAKLEGRRVGVLITTGADRPPSSGVTPGVSLDRVIERARARSVALWVVAVAGAPDLRVPDGPHLRALRRLASGTGGTLIVDTPARLHQSVLPDLWNRLGRSTVVELLTPDRPLGSKVIVRGPGGSAAEGIPLDVTIATRR